MSRDLGADFIAEVSADGMYPIMLISAHFDSGDLNIWNGLGTLTYGLNQYLGTIPILGIDAIREQKKTAATGLNITLSGLDTAIAELCDNEPYQGRNLEVALAVLDEAGAIIGTPYTAFEGFMDVMKSSDSGKSIDVTVSVENALVSLERARDSKYTQEDQKIEFPNDTGFSFVSDIQNRVVTWG